MKPMTIVLSGAVALLLTAADANAAAGDTAVAQLKDAKGKEVGTVEFRETASGMVWVTAMGTGLPPGKHGFHVHETGQCDAADGFKSAGGHLAGDKSHGVLHEDGAHPGDLPNVHVGDDGKLAVEAFVASLSVEGGGGGWFDDVGLFDEDGTAVVIHSGADDYQSQPSGDAGDRIACGVIQKQ